MDNCITMIKYQGLGNDYLVLDPNKNRVQLQGKKIALLCQRGFGLGADGILYGPIQYSDTFRTDRGGMPEQSCYGVSCKNGQSLFYLQGNSGNGRSS